MGPSGEAQGPPTTPEEETGGALMCAGRSVVRSTQSGPTTGAHRLDPDTAF
jgi:hypothetical protein